MKNIIIVAAIAALSVTTPALADRGHGNGHGNGKGNNRADVRGDRDDRGEVRGNRDNVRGDQRDGRNGREGWGRYGAWGNNCPPGLAKKNNGCMAPGQARKRYREGQRWSGTGTAWSYNQIPYDWRQQYNLSANDRYYYRDGYLYQVDRRTNMVEQVLSAILR